MNRGALSLNIRYCLIHLFYWVAYVALISFASVYFLDKGLSNTMIGFILAGGNICSVILQPVIATMLDDHPELSIKQVVATLFLLMLVFSVAVQMLDLSKFALGTLVVLLLTMFLSASPLINTLAFQRGREESVNFGLARGIGSLAYALAGIFVGYMVEKFGPADLPIYYALPFLCVAILSGTFGGGRISRKKAGTEQASVMGANSSLLGFFNRYRAFTVFMLGGVLVFFAHFLVAYFAIQVIEPIGGNSTDLGMTCFLSAIGEVPVMLLFIYINRKFSAHALLRFTAVMFVVKQVLIFLATSIPVFYVAQLLQMGGYGLFIPASVVYVNQLMREGDLVRGQTLTTVAPTIGSVFASMAGGILLDVVGVRGMLFISVIASFAGAAVMLAASRSAGMCLGRGTVV